jgi:hypothetical protein
VLPRPRPGGQPRSDGSETKEVRWVEPSGIGQAVDSMRRRIDDALADATEPQIV